MINGIRYIRTFLILLFFTTYLIGMNDPAHKSQREALKTAPGCIRQNSEELRKVLFELATTQGNLELLNELKTIEAKFAKEEAPS